MTIRSSTGVLGVIGDPIGHSFSPDMHNAAIQALEVDYCYAAFQVLKDRVGEAIRGMRGLGIRGLNVTIPHKVAVIEFLDKISEEALAVGAVNTISFEEDELVGYNTDVYGVLTALRTSAGIDRFPDRCAVLGAGGAARAVVYAIGCQEAVRKIHILNRTLARAEKLASDMEKITGTSIEAAGMGSDVKQLLDGAGLVVNTTSVGMAPNVDASPLAEDVIDPNAILYDTVFNPLKTKLMEQFESAGAAAIGGLDMLVHQGARSFEIWTGVTPPADVMKNAIVGRFKS